MRSLAKYLLQLAFGSALAAFGLCKLLSQLFLGGWQQSSAGQPDIAARGVWLLAIFLPAFAIMSVCAATAFALLMTGRTGPRLIERLAGALIGAAAGALLIVVGGDPTAFALSRASPGWLSQSVAILFAVVVLSWGLVTIVALRRAHYKPPVPVAPRW